MCLSNTTLGTIPEFVAGNFYRLCFGIQFTISNNSGPGQRAPIGPGSDLFENVIWTLCKGLTR